MTSIESLLPEHFEQVAAWLSRPQVNKWLTGEWRGRETSPSMLAIALRNRRNSMFLVRHEAQPCGLVALADIDTADRIAMVWYLLGNDQFSGRGVTSDALGQMTKVAFSEMGLASVHAWVMENNFASRRVLEKSGFQEVGRLRQSACFEGKQVDRIYFDLVQSI